jgi:hypothetical protein
VGRPARGGRSRFASGGGRPLVGSDRDHRAGWWRAAAVGDGGWLGHSG